MDMPKLLIADSSDEFRQILCDDLCDHYTIKTCRDGLQALELLRSFRPDILILDLMLPELDGLTLLRRANEAGIHPAVLVTSTFCSDYIVGALQKLGVSYLMAKPCDLAALTEHLADLTTALHPSQISMLDLSSAVSDVLLRLHIPTRLDGFLFLQEGIPMYLRDPGQSMTKELYVNIGNAHNKSGQQVERSIRNAIDKAWAQRNDNVWRQYFSAPGGTIFKPCNREFFSRIAIALAQQGYSQKGA